MMKLPPYEPGDLRDLRESFYDEDYREGYDLVDADFHENADWDVDDYDDERRERGIPDLLEAGLLVWPEPRRDDDADDDDTWERDEPGPDGEW